ncbi:MAG: Uncharacterized protein XD60_0098 [Acetothermia bacterium 64_32]|nr:MAG: Uncharacterized protein XD60_0098 [Acetothermia bacterium 64_32]
MAAFPQEYVGSIIFQGGHGAKALGMGGAYCALANDATGALWNPAGLTFAQPWIGGATSNRFSTGDFGGVSYQYISGGFTFEGYAIGLGWANAVANDEANPGMYNASLYLGTVGVNIADFGSVGVNVKYYSETIEEDSATGFGFDIGLLFPLTDELAIGIVAKDVGGTSLWDQTVEPMYTAGFGAKLLDGAMTLAADVDFAGMDFAFSGAKAGLEFVLVENLAVRAGVVFPEADFADYYFTVGAGLAVGDLSIDAAYVLQSDPGESLVLSATFLLGELLAPPAEEGQPTE